MKSKKLLFCLICAIFIIFVSSKSSNLKNTGSKILNANTKIEKVETSAKENSQKVVSKTETESQAAKEQKVH